MDQPLATQEDANRLAKGFEQRLLEITEWGVELRTMKPTLMRANLALERSKEIRKYLEDVEASDLREFARRMYELHKFLTALLKRIKNPAEVVGKFCADIRADYEADRRRKIEAERRTREEQANALVQAQRAAEVNHLNEIGRPTEAANLAAAPIPPVSVNVDQDAGKVEGEIMVEVWVPKLDDNEEFIFTDLTGFLHWIADKPEFHYTLSHKFGKWKKLLTDNRGLLQPPGMVIEHKFEARTRMDQ
jgi:hypothetical protein